MDSESPAASGHERTERCDRLKLWTATYAAAWFRAFVFTQAVEGPLYRYVGKARWRVALGASALTHPFVWFLFPYLLLVPGCSFAMMVGLAELFAWSTETVFVRYFARLSWGRSALLSLLANGASMLLGTLVRAWTGYP